MQLLTNKPRHDLEKLLKENHDTFAEDERQIGTSPLIKMSIDTGDHPTDGKVSPMLWPLNTMTGSGRKLTNCLKQVSSEKSTQVGWPQLWLYPKAMLAKGYVWISEP